MSITKTREILERARRCGWAGADAALVEVEAIEMACRTLESEGIKHFVHKVRDRAAADTSFRGNTLEHPRVVAYIEAAQVVTNIAKESEA